MPTDTFFRLPEEKRNKILRAMRNEFARVPYEEISINRIIHEADIPRGSFYQYFQDKQDLFTYLVQECHAHILSYVEHTLRESSGDPFEFAVRLFDAVADVFMYKQLDCDLYRNLLGNLRLQNQEFFRVFREAGYGSYLKIKSLVNGARLRVHCQEELDDALDMIHAVLHQSICDLLSGGQENTDAVRRRLVSKINMLKSGLMDMKEDESWKDIPYANL